MIDKANLCIQKINSPNAAREAKLSIMANNSDKLFLKYGVHSELLDQPLLVGRNKTLYCEVLYATPHGRHLLLLSLLEHLDLPYWTPRCYGMLRLYLPESLMPEIQPQILDAAGSCQLKEIYVDGEPYTRVRIKDQFLKYVPENEDFSVFSWNKERHRQAISLLLEWTLNMPNFGSSLSLLVTMKHWVSQTMYVELVNLVLVGRNDTGFILPSMASYMPHSFIKDDELEVVKSTNASEQLNIGRQKRQAFNRGDTERYFREDTVANSHHSDWHRFSFGQRRGESFYYMHGQMVARYEAERLCLGLPTMVDFGPGLWNNRVPDSYNPRLGWAWSTRRPGYINAQSLRRPYRQVTRMLDTAPSYVGGVDRGIDWFGQTVERELHNFGHVQIAQLSGSRGVMGSTLVAMRDPIFFRWHGFIQSIFQQYKDNLNHNRRYRYDENDLGFPGVSVQTASVLPVFGSNDTFYTCMEFTDIRVDSLDGTSPGTRMSVQYRRLDHRPFTYNYVIRNDNRDPVDTVIRVFMIPRGGNIRTTIQMDLFYQELQPGLNYIRREELDAPHLSKSRWSLHQLQSRLLNGQVSQMDFSWGGCGWPRHLNIPRGSERGMEWQLVVMVSQVLDNDLRRIRNWSDNQNLAWSYCGVRWGSVPDSRPMGFPFDRSFISITSLAARRSNWLIKPVVIRHGEC